MRVLIFSNIKWSHTIRWVTGLADRGIEVIITGFGNENEVAYEEYNNITSIPIDIGYYPDQSNSGGIINKLKIVYAERILKNIIKTYKPDIIHAHYASHYGLVASLTNFHPFILSVWGDDITVYPQKSLFHNLIIRFNLGMADRVLATSKFLAENTEKYTSKNVTVTPFGINTNFFKPINIESIFGKNDFVIGTLKPLEKIYGVDILIETFKLLNDKYPESNLKLLIVGDGSQRTKLEKLVSKLNLTDKVKFTGWVRVEKIPWYHNMLDIFVALSYREGFGVSALEALACENPVVVSDVGGFKEIVVDGEIGYRVPPGKPERAAIVIEKLIFNSELREKMGKKGREWVLKNYDKEKSLDLMINIYKEVLMK